MCVSNADLRSSNARQSLKQLSFFERIDIKNKKQCQIYLKHCFYFLYPVLTKKNGTPGGNRTHDKLLRRQLLYPLSYRSTNYNIHHFFNFSTVICRIFCFFPLTGANELRRKPPTSIISPLPLRKMPTFSRAAPWIL